MNTRLIDNELENAIDTLCHRAKQYFHRECLVITGEQDWCIQTIEQISHIDSTLNLSESLLISSKEIDLPRSTSAPLDNATNYLGREFNHAIINCHDGFDPNAIGAISGTVRGGGLFILLTPTLKTLPNFDDPEKKRMAIWPYKATDVSNRFLERLASIFEHTEKISIISESGYRLSKTASLDSPHDRTGYLENEACLTTEQQQAVEAILHVVDGHRRRPLVITADRGRGKSSALGIAAAELLKRGEQNIIVSGPRQNATKKVFEHAAKHLQIPDKSAQSRLSYHDSMMQYFSVDSICQHDPECSLLLIDEAAAIPVNILSRLLEKYSRVVFASTTYGYEGTGRGFQLRFFKELDNCAPGWKQLEMTLPARWDKQDPVEQFIFELLCLNAEPQMTPKASTLSDIEIQRIDRATLVDNNEELTTIFGLLVLAHYKTQPRDLRYLLDSLNLEVFVARANGTIVGATLVELEGELDQSISQQVHDNQRRVQGHLLAQLLESTLGIKSASHARFMRVIRIIVHPELQRQGIGKKLLSAVEAYSLENNIDIIGASFGASDELLPFWASAGYSAIHIGLKPNTNTGTHSINFIKALSDKGKNIKDNCKILFNQKLNYLLSSAYRDLDTTLIEFIYSTHTSDAINFSDRQKEEVEHFSESSIGYAMASQAINIFIHYKLYEKSTPEKLSSQELQLLVKKVLQQHSWNSVVKSLGFSGKNQAVECLRGTIKKLLSP